MVKVTLKTLTNKKHDVDVSDSTTVRIVWCVCLLRVGVSVVSVVYFLPRLTPLRVLCPFFSSPFQCGSWAQVLELKERIHSEFQLGEVADQKLMYVCVCARWSSVCPSVDLCGWVGINPFLDVSGSCVALSRSGKILKDAETMAEAGMKDGDFIVVMVSKV